MRERGVSVGEGELDACTGTHLVVYGRLELDAGLDDIDGGECAVGYGAAEVRRAREGSDKVSR